LDDFKVLEAIALDHETGAPIDAKAAKALIASRSAFVGIETIQQAVYALFDLRLHGDSAQHIADGKYTSCELFTGIWNEALPDILRDPKSAWHHR
jgi:Zn-dependent oligopeptidase